MPHEAPFLDTRSQGVVQAYRRITWIAARPHRRSAAVHVHARLRLRDREPGASTVLPLQVNWVEFVIAKTAQAAAACEPVRSSAMALAAARSIRYSASLIPRNLTP